MSQGALLAVATAAAALFLLYTVLSTTLVAVAALSRVALHRLSNGGGRFAFFGRLREASSAHRLAVVLARQLCLLGAVALVIVGARATGSPNPAAIGLGFGALVGVLVLELGLARALALWDPKAALRWTAPLVVAVHALCYPLVRPLERLLTHVDRYQQDDERDEDQEEEVEAFIEVGEREGILEADEGEMMRNVADLDETVVREIMTPRTDIVALASETSVADARRAIIAAGHSRLPVYGDSLDNVIGVLHERDLLRAWEAGNADESIAAYTREAMFVPEQLAVDKLLAEMRLKKHIAIVVDEYGGAAGLVTLEDLLEEIVGEIREEHDDEVELFRQDSDGSWIVNAGAHVEELEERFGFELEERDFDTVGGLVVSRFGRVPNAGERLQLERIEIEVLEADRRRIRIVRIRLVDASSEASAR